MSLTYSVVLRPEPEGGFTVRVPAFPEIVTFGANEQEAMDMARDAIELVITSRQENGEAVPSPDTPLYREVKIDMPAA